MNFFLKSAGTFEDMSAVGSSYQTEKPRAASGASNLKARFEKMAQGDEEVRLIFCKRTVFESKYNSETVFESKFNRKTGRKRG